jgi:hypothetical protein
MEISGEVKIYAYDIGAVRYVEICIHTLCQGDKVGDIATHELRNMTYQGQLLPTVRQHAFGGGREVPNEIPRP